MEDGRTDEAWSPKWTNRRRTIFSALAYCGLSNLYIMINDSGSQLHEAIATSNIFLAGAIIGSYVFGVVYQNVKLKK